jgi:hypothetical protein
MTIRPYFVATLILAGALPGCATALGTKLTINAESAAAVRASDQEVLATAIDKALDGLDLPRVSGGSLVTAWVDVQSATPLPRALLDYTASRVAAAAGGAGFGILEQRLVLERARDASLSVLTTEYPDTDARIVVSVAVAGVDETREQLVDRSSDSRSTVIKGRFRATVSLVSRKAAMPKFSQAIQGDSRFEFVDGKYVDLR